MSQSPFPGPIAPENNPPIMAQYFAPGWFPITAITLGMTTTVTTSANFGLNCNYVIGQEVRLNIPIPYGAQQLSGQTGYVISIPMTNQVVLSINSTGFSPFVSSPAYGPTLPQIVAIGDVNSGIISSTGQDVKDALLPGSFQNISPAVFR